MIEKIPDDDREDTDAVTKASAADTDSESAIADAEPSSGKSVKKRTWKKPKDKPKRPLSAYNIFFQHARFRIVEDQTEEATTEEIVRSIEGILSKSREKRRHRKSHGRISFGDLARAIADQWKNLNPKHKEIFDHYAEIDMIRYRRELKLWKEKKELESEASAMARHTSFVSTMNSSFNSTGGDEMNLGILPDEGAPSSPRVMHDSFNSSHSSVASFPLVERRNLQSSSMSMMIQRQQQILRQQLREENNSVLTGTRPIPSSSQLTSNTLPGSHAFHQSFASLPSRPSDLEESGLDFQQQQTMEQLRRQQDRQLEQMRQLQMQQRMIQQQLEMHRNQLQLNSGMTNLNMQRSSISDMSSQAMLGQPQHQLQMQTYSFGHSSMDQSMNLGDALLAPSVVSDYSSSALGQHSSSVFGASSARSLGMSQSDSMITSSIQGDIQAQLYQQQQHQHNQGSVSRMRQRPNQGVGGFSFSSSQDQQNDLQRFMDMDG